jgi:hypothetical protein
MKCGILLFQYSHDGVSVTKKEGEKHQVVHLGGAVLVSGDFHDGWLHENDITDRVTRAITSLGQPGA